MPMKPRMFRLRAAPTLPLLALLAGLGVQLPARADIFLCVDAAGRRELTDTARPGCKQLDVPGNIPAPRKAAGGGSKAAPVATPSDFPKVGNAQQRTRDEERRKILNDELASEEGKLAAAKREFANGEPERVGGERNYAKYQARVDEMRQNIARIEQNIIALKREIANIK